MDEHDAVLKAAERDVATVIGDRRTHAGLDQLLDLSHRLGVLAIEKFISMGRFRPLRDDRCAGQEVLHDGAEDRWLDVLPLPVGFRDRDEVTAEKHAGHPRNAEQLHRQWRIGGLSGARNIENALGKHRPAGQELQGGRIGGCFGLDEHLTSPLPRRVQGPMALDNMGGSTGQVNRPRPPSVTRLQVIASSSSSFKCPGTMATGIGNAPAVAPRLDTSGPGPSGPTPAASTSTEISSSSSINLRICSGISPSRMTHSGVMPAMLFDRAAKVANMAVASSWASARMMSATPSHCWL